MTHEVYISYSAQDKAVADAVCTTLERKKFKCWISPRDILPGKPYSASVVNAIRDSRVFVLILSESSNLSTHVIREVSEAITNGITIIPFRIEDVEPSGVMSYYIISSLFWLDAITSPLEQHLAKLTGTVQELLASRKKPQEDQQSMGVEHFITENQVTVDDKNTTYSATEKKTTLSAFAQALLREAHVLQDRPDLLWQQLYNRLWWDSRVRQSMLSDALEKRDSVWLRRLSPIVESPLLLRTMTGHGSRTLHYTDEEDIVESNVNDCDVSPDGGLVISGGSEGKLLIHEVATGRLEASLQYNFMVESCAFDPTGRHIVLVDSDGLKVLDAQTYGELWDYSIVLNNRALAVSPDGCWIVVGVGRTAEVLDAENGTVLAAFDGHKRRLEDCAFTPDGQRVVSCCRDGTIRIWDPRSAEEEAVLLGHKSWVLGCSVSPSGDLVVSGGMDQTVRVWDLHRAALQATLEGHVGHVTSCCVTQDGTMIVSAGTDGTIRLWDLRSGELRATFKGHGGPVICCAVTANDRFIVSGGADGTVRVWSAMSEGGVIEETPNGGSNAPALWESGAAIGTLSPDGRWMVTGRRKLLRIWDAESGARHSEINADYQLNRCAISSDSSWMVTADTSKGLTIRSVPVGRELSRRELEASDLAVAYQWMPRPRHPNPNYDVGFDINACAVDPSGRWIATASDDGAIRLWTVSPLKVDAVLGTHDDVASDCAISPDGSWVVSAGKDGVVRVWDTVQRCLRVTFNGHEGPVPCCAVSPDGSFVVSGGADRRLRIWEIRGGQLRATLQGHQGRVSACAVGPDGRLIASVADDGTLRVWCALSGSQLALLPLSGAAGWVLFDPARPVIWSSGGFVTALELLGHAVEPPEGDARAMLKYPL
jgi:WD40 repeat protein